MEGNLELNLLEHQAKLKLKKDNGKRMIWCIVRKKWLVLTPEEMVRQLFLEHLIYIGVGVGRISVEKEIEVNGMRKRFDILVFNEDSQMELLVECKRPEVSISQKVMDQVSLYNIALKTRLLVVTNGPETYCCEVDWEEKSYKYLSGLPPLSVN